MITLTFNDIKFRAEFSRRMKAVKNPHPMLLAAGREVGDQLKSWFRQRDKETPNKLGGRRTHFWLAVSRTVQNPQLEGANAVSVSINHPAFAQKVFGGTIRAKAAGALTIPITPQAYGHTAQDFPGAFLIHTSKGAYIVKLGENITVSGRISMAKRRPFKGQRAHLNFLFKLVKSVNQPADREALPPKSQLETAILERAQEVIDIETGGNSSN